MTDPKSIEKCKSVGCASHMAKITYLGPSRSRRGISMWVCVGVCVGVCGCVGVWVCGCVGVWVYVYIC